jgi:hypothetical protein
MKRSSVGLTPASRLTVDSARSQVVQQACEAVASGPGEHEGLRRAVIAYYRACGDDSIAARLESEACL